MYERIIADIKALEPGEGIIISIEGRLYFIKAATLQDFKGEK